MATTLPVVAAVSTAVLRQRRRRKQVPRLEPPRTSLPFHPGSIVVLGDSTALDLSYALAATAPPGFRVIGSATFGCGLAMGTEISAFPPKPELPSAPACNDATPPAWQWPAIDTRAVADTGPRDIVLFLAGHDDTTGILQDGRWSDIRSPAFQRTELGLMREMVAIATTHGAHLELLTMPCMNAAYRYHRKPWPDDSPQRRSIFNHLLREAAEESPGQVSVVNFGSMLCPGREVQVVGRRLCKFDLSTVSTPPRTPEATPSSPTARPRSPSASTPGSAPGCGRRSSGPLPTRTAAHR